MKNFIKIFLIVLGITVVFLIVVALIFTFLTSAKKVDFDVKITKMYLLENPNISGYDVLRGNDKEELAKNSDNYVGIYYGVEYSSDKKFHTKKPITTMSTFFDIEYPNALNDLMINHTRLKDFGFSYVPKKVYTHGVEVVVKRDDYSNEQILEMAQKANIKIFALENFNMNDMMTRK